MNLHAVAQSRGWAIFHLSDGRPYSNTVYPSWTSAVLATKWNRDNYLYLELQPDGMPYKEAQAVLHYQRTLSRMGYRIPPPDNEASASVGELASISGSLAQPYDRARMARQLVSGKPLDTRGYTNVPPAYRKAI